MVEKLLANKTACLMHSVAAHVLPAKTSLYVCKEVIYDREGEGGHPNKRNYTGSMSTASIVQVFLTYHNQQR